VDDDKQISKHTFEHGWDPHSILGNLIVLGGLILLLLALGGRVGRPRVMQSLAIFVLLIVQLLLAALGFAVPALGWFHPVNALVLVGLTGRLAHSTWTQERAATRVAPQPTAP
jgi:hypothetical protein